MQQKPNMNKYFSIFLFQLGVLFGCTTIQARVISLAEPGTLSSHITQADYDTLRGLIIVGPINSDDIFTIRHLCGAWDTLEVSRGLPKAKGKVCSLDLRKAVIVKDKRPFLDQFSSRHFWGSRTVTTRARNGYTTSHTHSYRYELKDPITKTTWRHFVQDLGQKPGHGCFMTWNDPAIDAGDGRVHEHFYACKNKISDFMFHNCQALKQIVLPEKVRVIGDYAFYGCPHLRHIICLKPINRYYYDTQKQPASAKLVNQ